MKTSIRRTGWLLAVLGLVLSAMTTTAAQPFITGITEQNIAINTATAKLAFSVGDAETPASDLVVTASSDVAALVSTMTVEVVAGSGGAARTIQIVPNTDSVGSAHITLTVTDGNGEVRTTSFLLNVLGPPGFVILPESLTVYEDDPASFTATSPGTSLIFSWLKNGLNFGGPTKANFTIARATFLDAGDYVAVVTSILTGLSATSSPPAHLTVLPGVGMSVNVNGSGAVFSTPSRITAPGPVPLQTAKFPPGSSVTLTATPAAGWQVSGWSVDGVAQPGAGLTLTVTMDTAHSVGVAFSPLPDAGGYGFIAISGNSSPGGPVSGGVYFDSVSGPQISDSGRVLFTGNLFSADASHPVLTQERTGLWYSRSRISAHFDNAIIRQTYSWLWYYLPNNDPIPVPGLPPIYPTYPLTPAISFGTAFTADGDITLGAQTTLNGSVVAVYAPYADLDPPVGPVPLPPRPRFRTLANTEQEPDFLAAAGTTNRWVALGGAVFQGAAPSAVPVLGGNRVAFSGRYVTYSADAPPATNEGLFSATSENGVGLIVPVVASGAGFRNMGFILGDGNGALASLATYSGGSGAGNLVVWTYDGGIQATVGSTPPNLPTGYPANTKFNSLLNLHLSKLGAVAFSAELTGTGLLNNSNMVYLRHRGELPLPVIRGGQVFTSAPAPANLFLVAAQDTVSVADNAQADLAIGAHLGSAGGPNVIIRHDSSGSQLAFIDGTPLPAFGPNKKLYLHRVTSTPAFWHPPTINAQGRIAFFGVVAESPPVSLINPYSRGIWMLETDGTLRQLLVEGQILPEFGRVDVITEPRGNRWFNNNGEAAVQILQQIQTTPTSIYKTAILKIGTGRALLPAANLGASSSSGTGALALRWPASYSDAVIERLAGFGTVSNVWERVTLPVRRIGPELEAEIAPTHSMEFFRLLLPPEPP